ncbi:phosphorylase [Candidimonas sp. SYP-B2681]|uniref:ATP adenylyltransferase family protein n=1 Tax=Candidimonas sp. SYP-B2681 TaxID=2497686 RepID=UPI000F8674A0|nr:phosphorylase [Candidimonas sp. SYP-B2681]RTZ42576.1 phosphorylase [Candidimonas sp. SYP-B2681]
MTTAFMQSVDLRSADARHSGALQPINAEQTEISDEGLPFVVRWVSSLSAKDGEKVSLPGGPRDPDFNPFLSPDPALTIGAVGDHHVAILNKFPVCDRHLVLARRLFEEQRAPLTLSDFAAISYVMSGSGGVGFYNGGAEAGASQRHKHLQWIPAMQGNANLRFFVPGLPAGLSEQAMAIHPQLPVKHLFIRVQCGLGTMVSTSASSLLKAFTAACQQLDLLPDDSGLLPPFNFLADNGWMLVVPRSCEHAYDVSVNALSYGGSLYVRNRDQVDIVRKVGPLEVLSKAAYVATTTTQPEALRRRQ